MGSSAAMSARDWCRVWWPTLAVVSCNPPSLWTGRSCDKWHLDTGPWSQGHDQQSASGGLFGGSGQYLRDTDFTSIKETFHQVGEGHDHFITMTVNIIVLYFQLTGNIYKQYRNWNSLVQRFMILMQCCRDSNSLSSISKYLLFVMSEPALIW